MSSVAISGSCHCHPGTTNCGGSDGDALDRLEGAAGAQAAAAVASERGSADGAAARRKLGARPGRCRSTAGLRGLVPHRGPLSCGSVSTTTCSVAVSTGPQDVVGGAGTAYRIRTGDLRLERAVSWASRRMRLRTAATDRCRDRIGMIATDRDRRQPSRPAQLAGTTLPARPYRRWTSRKPRMASATC